MDISARATSLADRPHWAIWVTSARMRREDRSSISSHPLADLGGLDASRYIIGSPLGGCRDFPRLEVPAMRKNAPGDARQLVGEGDGEHVVVQPLLGRLGLLTGRSLDAWTAIFLVTTILTSVTGFPLEPFGFDPARAIGLISLVLPAAAVVALYAFHLASRWRSVYIVAAATTLYLNVFIGVVQAFQKLPFLLPLAPTQSEPPFV